jgi:signal transduction histidine kinase
VGAGLLAAALAAVSSETLRLEDAERAAREDALREERIRQVLWRMDSALASVLAVEAGRNPGLYEVAWMGSAGVSAGTLPSPFLTGPPSPEAPPFVRVHFKIRRGVILSPEDPGPLLGIFPPLPSWAEDRPGKARAEIEVLRRAGLGTAPGPDDPSWGNPRPDSADYGQRAERNLAGQQQAIGANRRVPEFFLEESPVWGPDVSVGPFAASWIPRTDDTGAEPILVFVRDVSDDSRQGFRSDWPLLRAWLLAEAREHFPSATLLPADPGASDGSRMLASLPARFEPGPSPAGAPRPRWTPGRTAVAIAWGAVAAAAVLAGLALRGALDLGERRGRFVSAVTHELRTPLTTFRMYSQMLHDGMAPAGAEKEYLATLQREAERLTRVVESVLLYARLEEGRGGAHRERIAAGALLDRVLPALERRAADGGLVLRAAREVPAAAALEVDPQAVEQVLGNLVDNACKYATGGGEVAVEARVEGKSLEVLVSDRGPGIPEASRRDVFEPFLRLPRDAAGPASGAGLGLAVARGLARALGGDLVLLRGEGPGAAFLLTLPLRA